MTRLLSEQRRQSSRADCRQLAHLISVHGKSLEIVDELAGLSHWVVFNRVRGEAHS